MDKREEILAEAHRWLLEMQFLNNPQMKTFLVTNIYSISNRIHDVNILLDTDRQQMLVYLELDFWGRVFRRQRTIEVLLLGLLREVLPSYRFRVVFDESIFNLALKRAEEFAKGQIKIDGQSKADENSNISNSSADNHPSTDGGQTSES